MRRLFGAFVLLLACVPAVAGAAAAPDSSAAPPAPARSRPVASAPT